VKTALMGSWSLQGFPAPMYHRRTLELHDIRDGLYSKVSSHHEPYIRESHEQKDANVEFPLLFLNETIPPIIVSYQFPTIPAEVAPGGWPHKLHSLNTNHNSLHSSAPNRHHLIHTSDHSPVLGCLSFLQFSAKTTIGLLAGLVVGLVTVSPALLYSSSQGIKSVLKMLPTTASTSRIEKHTPANVIHDFQSNSWANHSFIIKPGIIRLSLQILIPSRIIKCFFASSFLSIPAF